MHWIAYFNKTCLGTIHPFTWFSQAVNWSLLLLLLYVYIFSLHLHLLGMRILSFLNHWEVAFLLFTVPPLSVLTCPRLVLLYEVQTARTSLIHTVVLQVSDPQAMRLYADLMSVWTSESTLVLICQLRLPARGTFSWYFARFMFVNSSFYDLYQMFINNAQCFPDEALFHVLYAWKCYGNLLVLAVVVGFNLTVDVSNLTWFVFSPQLLYSSFIWSSMAFWRECSRLPCGWCYRRLMTTLPNTGTEWPIQVTTH